MASGKAPDPSRRDWLKPQGTESVLGQVLPRTAESARKRRVGRRWAMEVAGVVGVYLALSSWQARNLVATGTAAPGFALTSLDGKTVTLESLKGKKVLLHFWATWCGVCRQEFGALNSVERQLAPDEVLLTVAADSDDPERLRRFVEDEHIQYPVLLGTESVLRAFHVSSFPTNYFVNGDGRVAGHTVGMSTRWGLAARLGCAKE